MYCQWQYIITMIAFPEKRPGTLMAAIRYFDAEMAEAFVRSIKWPGGMCCPECGSVNVGHIKSRNRHQCREKGCRKQFSVTTGTIMEGSHLRLEQWIVAVWMIVNCRNGVSSCEIARNVGCKQQSAWHLLHRVRHILTPEHTEQLDGVVECDETYVGGLVKFMHADRRERALAGEGHKGKAIVFGMLERSSGKVRAHTMPAATTKNVRESVLANIRKGAELNTDKSSVYRWSGDAYTHRSVNHGAGEYVKGTVTTNALEGFFNCLRRGLKGTYIKATPKHLSAYVDEQVWRFNARKLTEWERFEQAMRLIVGKKLTYSELTDGATR